MLFFATVDFIRPGRTLHFGIDQLAGFVISAIIVLAGLHTTHSPRAKTWFGALLLIYMAGILFMGLKPSGHSYHLPKKFLIASRPPIYDFIINILGFIPLAYLTMAYLFSAKQVHRIANAAIIALTAGMGASLFMELVQFHIPGRTSSLIDLIANTAGTLIGIAYFLFEKKIQGSSIDRRWTQPYPTNPTNKKTPGQNRGL